MEFYLQSMMKKVFYLVLVFTFYITGINAQEELLFTQISTQDGLAQNTVRSILVDQKGYVWIGTLDGLVRYDGTRFINHKPKPGISTNLSDQRIRDIFEDKDGYIWVRMYDNSFSCYNPQFEQFIPIQYNDKKRSLFYTNYLELENGEIWLWGNAGCVQIEKDENLLPKIVFSNSKEENVLSDTEVRFVFQDSEGTQWIGCSKGLNKRDASGNITQFYKDASYGSFRKALEHDGMVYFLSNKNIIYRYDISKQSFVSPLRSPDKYRFFDFSIINNNSLLVSAWENDVLRLNLTTNQFTTNALKTSEPFDSPPQFILDENNDLWIYDHSGRVIYYDAKTGYSKELQLIAPEIAEVIDDGRYNILIDDKGIYWITTYGNGLYYYDKANDELVNYTYKQGMNSPASDYLLSLTEDNYGNIWIGCEYAGALKVTKKKYKVEYLKPEQNQSIGTGNNIKVIYKDSDQNIWVGAKNGSLYLYNNQLELKQRIKKGINPYTIEEDDKGRVWVGTKGNGIYIFDRTNYEELHHLEAIEDEESLCNNSIFDIIQDQEGHMWVASFGGGMDLISERKGQFYFKHFFDDQGNISYIRCLLQDSDGLMWAGSYDGLICFKPDDFVNNSSAYTLYSYNLGHSAGLNSNDIKALYEDSKKRLWVGTAGGGINLFDKSSEDKQGAFIKYTKEDGLPSNIIAAIMESKDSVLWVSSESGLSHFDEERNTFVNYLFSNSSYGNYYNENASLLKDNGEMLWGTLQGLLVFNPSSFVANAEVPKVELTDMLVFDQRLETGTKNSLLIASIGKVKEVVLPYDQNTFTLNFACLDLTDPSANKYSYNLEPYDQYWSTPSKNNWATYKNMVPGQYEFKVRGANADGQWNNEITTCKITILPPFWKSKYAIAAYILIMSVIAYIIFRIFIKMNGLNNAVKMEKQLTDYKLRFFTNISHEFRTPLTLIKGSIERMNDIENLPDEVSKNVNLLNRNTQQMSRLIDQLLEFRKLQNNVLTLNLEKTDISDFTLNAFYTFKEIAFQKNIDYQFDGIHEKWDVYIDRNKVEKILFNLLSNAFKFTPADGKIIVRLSKDEGNNKCVIQVADTGVGVPKDKQELLFSRFMKLNPSAEGTGIGLELVKEFIEAHKGQVSYASNPEGGSIFTIELPVDPEIYGDANFLDSNEESDNKEVAYNEDHAVKRPANPSNYKVLVIDDNYDIRQYLSEELKHHFQVEVAADGKEGLEKAISINPTLIICDVKMPEMDGLQLTKKLKEDFETSHIPVILLTALSSETIKLQGSESGADEYIMKPFSLKYLLSRAYALIEQREKLKKRFSIDISVKKAIVSEADKDQQFYDLINTIVDENLSDPEFTVAQFTQKAKLSRTIFYKKVKGLTGYSPNELIKIKRMKRAAELLLEDKYNVSEVSWKVGIEDPFYFSKCFKAQFGCAPSKYGVDTSNSVESK